MISEKEYVIKNFENYFSVYKDKPLVIYGIGVNTEAVLNELKEYNVVGLMDEVHTGDIIYGKKVITCEEALQLGTEAIIIIARVANVPIIFQRIAEFCQKKMIPVYDIYGNIQVINDRTMKRTDPFYKEMTRSHLYETIDQCEVISFDIFDTILMRKTLFPTDVFEKAEKRFKESGIHFPFSKERRKAELDLLATGKQPTIYEIYDNMSEFFAGSRQNLSDYLKVELEIEDEVLCVREEIRDALLYAQNRGKHVCLTSDMYLPAPVLLEYLKKRGIILPIDCIYVSCEQKCAKNNGLFEILRKNYEGKTILHIGDNVKIDGEMALEFGIDKVFLVRSAFKQFQESSAHYLFKYSYLWENRWFIGNFVENQFNDPFAFEKTDGKIQIRTAYELGYYMITPLLLSFFSWMVEKSKEFKLDKVLLSSRDGYILNRLARIEKNKHPDVRMPDFTYFYASREACVLASIKSEEDIRSAASLPFASTSYEMLKRRFKLIPAQIKTRRNDETELDYILRHKMDILHSAEKLRKNYMVYLEKNEINKEKRMGYFDFVSGGTCQNALYHIGMINLVGLYFFNYSDPLKNKSLIQSMYVGVNETNVDSAKWVIEEIYFLLEGIMTSYEPTLSGFNEEGDPVFGNEYRNEIDFNELREIHMGIEEAYAEYEISDKKMADGLISLLRKDNLISDIAFLRKKSIYDEFCNRVFNINCF